MITSCDSNQLKCLHVKLGEKAMKYAYESTCKFAKLSKLIKHKNNSELSQKPELDMQVLLLKVKSDGWLANYNAELLKSKFLTVKLSEPPFKPTRISIQINNK